MLILVSGGSGSGKSQFAEDLSVRGPAPRVYIATMQIWDTESEKRVARHRAMRSGKGFATLERPTDLAGAEVPSNATVLLEDLSNLTANEWFSPQGAQGAAARVLAGVDRLNAAAGRLIIVTNELFSDGMDYGEETAAYLAGLAGLNRAIARRADAVYEVVCGIPVCHKGVDA